jgi:hypothetical protein
MESYFDACISDNVSTKEGLMTGEQKGETFFRIERLSRLTDLSGKETTEFI